MTNDAHAHHLPAHWVTLYELTKLTDEQFTNGIGADVDERRIAAELSPAQRALFAKFLLFLADVLEGVEPDFIYERAIAAGGVFREVAIEFGHDAADLTALGCAMFRAGEPVH